MRKVRFKPNLTIINQIKGHRELIDITSEKNVFSMSIANLMVLSEREPHYNLAREILSTILLTERLFIIEAVQSGLHAVIDTRIQQLMPGMYPSIPGWHGDAVPRKSYYSQPDFDLINPKSYHYECLLSSNELGVSNTEFFLEDVNIKFKKNELIWRKTHKAIEEYSDSLFLKLAGKKVRTQFLQDGQIGKFDCTTIHRASPAHNRGWRMFFRLSLYHNPPLNVETNQQPQVYLLSEENGW